ncbi:MAG: permease-like cell division protein FtsX [Oscillospiraceae bacterium]|nr:permease-like cell division protein FtsX [Oscillospiraceae bacterium]
MRWSNFTFLVKKGVHSVWYNRLMSFASFCVLLVSLLLVGLSALAGANINVVLDYVEDRNEVLVFTDGDLLQTETAEISEALMSSVYTTRTGVNFYSKEEAWVDFKQENPDADLIYERMDFNPMPNTFIVTISDLTKISDAVRDFQQIDGVQKVSAPHDFAEFLIGIRNTLTIIGGAIILALVVVCLVIIYNSSRASVFARRQEINIMKYVGATNSFVKIPFFIEGLFIGILAGIASWGLTQVAYTSIISLFGNDVTLWRALDLANLIEFKRISWIVLAANCLAGSLLSGTGIIMSMGKHLKV